MEYLRCFGNIFTNEFFLSVYVYNLTVFNLTTGRRFGNDHYIIKSRWNFIILQLGWRYWNNYNL